MNLRGSVNGDSYDLAIDLIKNLRSIEYQLPLSFLRSEARILALIKEEPGRPVKYYLSKSELSYRGFFNILSLLLKSGLITEEQSAEDRRQKLLR